MPQALLFYALSFALVSLVTIKHSLLINSKDTFLYNLAKFTEGRAIFVVVVFKNGSLNFNLWGEILDPKKSLNKYFPAF